MVSCGQLASTALANEATPSTTISQPSRTSSTRPSGSEVVGQRRRRVVGAEWHADLERDRRGDQRVLGNRRQ